MSDHYKCRQFQELLEEWLLGELDADRDQLMEAHFVTCHQCAELAEQTAEFLSHARSMDAPEPSHAALERLYDGMLDQLEQQHVFEHPTIPRKGELPPSHHRRNRSGSIAVAAALFFALMTAGAISSRIHRTDLGGAHVESQVTSRATLFVPTEVHAPIRERQRQFDALIDGPHSR